MMEDFVSREIGEQIFDCLNSYHHNRNQDSAAAEQNVAAERTQRESDNSPSKEWSRIAKELGIVSLTVLSVSPGTHSLFSLFVLL